MSVLIKGATMPKNCYECTRTLGLDYLECPANNARYDPAVGTNKRYDDCPLVEIPPHGDLIDRDNLMDVIRHKLHDRAPSSTGVLLQLVFAPTVIEGDENNDSND